MSPHIEWEDTRTGYIICRFHNWGPQVRSGQSLVFCLALEPRMFLHLLLVEKNPKKHPISWHVKITEITISVFTKFYETQPCLYPYILPELLSHHNDSIESLQQRLWDPQSLRHSLPDFLQKKSANPVADRQKGHLANSHLEQLSVSWTTDLWDECLLLLYPLRFCCYV